VKHEYEMWQTVCPMTAVDPTRDPTELADPRWSGDRGRGWSFCVRSLAKSERGGDAPLSTRQQRLTTIGRRRRVVGAVLTPSSLGRLRGLSGAHRVHLATTRSRRRPRLPQEHRRDRERTAAWLRLPVHHPARQLQVLAGTRHKVVGRQVSVHIQLYTSVHKHAYTYSRYGKEPEPCKNEPNQNPGFATNRIEPESKKCARTRTKPNRTP